MYMIQNNMTYTRRMFIRIIQNMTYTGTVFIYIIHNNLTYTRTMFICIIQNMTYTGTVFIYIIQNNMTYTGTVFIYIIQNNMTCTGTLFISSKTTWHILGQCLFLSFKTTWHVLGHCLYHPKQRNIYRESECFFFHPKTWHFVFWLCFPEPASCLPGSVLHGSRYWPVAVEHLQHPVSLYGSVLYQANDGANWPENRNTDASPCVCDFKNRAKFVSLAIQANRSRPSVYMKYFYIKNEIRVAKCTRF